MFFTSEGVQNPEQVAQISCGNTVCGDIENLTG